nr:hypothetical protein BN993_02067 [Virgibacillus halodenitrificans]
MIYGEIVFFVALIFFLLRGIYFIKQKAYTSAILCLFVVLIFLALAILKYFIFPY